VADSGLFIGWGHPVRGREAKGLEVFNESVQQWGQYQQDGKIESFEVGLLYPHGGDLAGFSLLRGTEEGLNALQAEDDFQRMLVRAAQIIDGLGVIRVALGDGLAQQIGIYQEAISELT
jgi:hypothetical protein